MVTSTNRAGSLRLRANGDEGAASISADDGAGSTRSERAGPFPGGAPPSFPRANPAAALSRRAAGREDSSGERPDSASRK